MPQTALLIPVPEAEQAVGAHRARLDRAAAWGVPAHITVLYPFLPPGRVDLGALAELFAAAPRFEGRLESVDWFGDTVVWLSPRPAERFRELTDLVWRRWPEAPPFGGEFDDVVPHLTIGHDHPRAVLAEAASAAAGRLPIAFAVDRVRLITGETGRTRWETVRDFPLG